MQSTTMDPLTVPNALMSSADAVPIAMGSCSGMELDFIANVLALPPPTPVMTVYELVIAERVPTLRRAG